MAGGLPAAGVGLQPPGPRPLPRLRQRRGLCGRDLGPRHSAPLLPVHVLPLDHGGRAPAPVPPQVRRVWYLPRRVTQWCACAARSAGTWARARAGRGTAPASDTRTGGTSTPASASTRGDMILVYCSEKYTSCTFRDDVTRQSFYRYSINFNTLLANRILII